MRSRRRAEVLPVHDCIPFEAYEFTQVKNPVVGSTPFLADRLIIFQIAANGFSLGAGQHGRWTNGGGRIPRRGTRRGVRPPERGYIQK